MTNTRGSCRLCGKATLQLARGLCPDCLCAFDEGYERGHADSGEECGCGYSNTIARCEHGTLGHLCTVCEGMKEAALARSLARQEAFDAKLRAANMICRGCGAAIPVGTWYKLCQRCYPIWLEYLAILPPAPVPEAAPRPPPEPAPVPKGDGPSVPMPRGPASAEFEAKWGEEFKRWAQAFDAAGDCTDCGHDHRLSGGQRVTECSQCSCSKFNPIGDGHVR